MTLSARDEEGVIGYHESMFTPPKIEPSATASLPSTRNVSGFLSRALTQYGMGPPQFSAA